MERGRDLRLPGRGSGVSLVGAEGSGAGWLEGRTDRTGKGIADKKVNILLQLIPEICKRVLFNVICFFLILFST